MMLFKRLFGHKGTPAAEPLRGVAKEETQAAQDATRKHMEAEVADDQERRGETGIPPASEQPPRQT